MFFPAYASKPPPLSVLVVDDSPTNLKIMEVVVSRLGHRVIVARNGLEAVELYRREQPDLVLMDIVMPGMDGLAAIREMQLYSSDRWTPVVFCSAQDGIEDVVKGLELGGDDYLVKPIHPRLLAAKINSLSRALAIERQLRAYAKELEHWQRQAEDQHCLASHVFARLTEAAGLKDPMLQHFNWPAADFSGDLICAARTPGDVLYLILADATGHGLPAALSALPVAQAFYSMAAKGFSLESIAFELNAKLHELLPVERFVAATLAAVDARNRIITVWNGGNPPVLLIDEAGEVIQRWPSRHPPLGILPASEFSGEMEAMRFDASCELLIVSDGLLEAQSPNGQSFALESVIEMLSSVPQPQRLNALVEAFKAHLAGGRPHDDASCLLARAQVEKRQAMPSQIPISGQRAVACEWRLEVSYSAPKLREVDVVPAVLGMVAQISLLKPHQGALFLILSELFNNALDHGLLELDSAVKEQPDGFARYLDQRAERLAKLSVDSRIDLGLHLRTVDGRAVVDITVADTGKGFDPTPYLGSQPGATQSQPHGRGILLVKSLCQELAYNAKGNCVRARYLL